MAALASGPWSVGCQLSPSCLHAAQRSFDAASDLAEALEDDLYLLRTGSVEATFRKTAIDYLNDWASPERGWLRKFYRTGSDEPHFDLTPSTEKAIAWICTLSDRSFVGTESRLLTLFDLLRQISEGSETDPSKRVEELQRRRDEIDAEIARVQSGDVPILNDTAVKDRFQQFTQLARELLTDFREVEQKFRLLDRSARERIALWDGTVCYRLNVFAASLHDDDFQAIVVIQMHVRSRQNHRPRCVLTLCQFFGKIRNMMVVQKRHGAHHRWEWRPSVNVHLRYTQARAELSKEKYLLWTPLREKTACKVVFCDIVKAARGVIQWPDYHARERKDRAIYGAAPSPSFILFHSQNCLVAEHVRIGTLDAPWLACAPSVVCCY